MDSHFPCVLTSSGTLESLNLKRWNTVWYKHSEARKTVTVSPGTLFFFKDLRKKNNTTWADTQTVMWGFNSRFLFLLFLHAGFDWWVILWRLTLIKIQIFWQLILDRRVGEATRDRGATWLPRLITNFAYQKCLSYKLYYQRTHLSNFYGFYL